MFSFESLAALAGQLPQNREVREKAQQLDEERRALLRGWEQKDDFLRQTFDLQIFNKEADQIDAATSSQEAFLEFQDVGVRVSISRHHFAHSLRFGHSLAALFVIEFRFYSSIDFEMNCPVINCLNKSTFGFL